MRPSRLLLTVMLTLFAPLIAMADEARDMERAKMLEQMRSIAQDTRVSVKDGNAEVTLLEKPLFRYDDQPRRLVDATIWAWTVKGRPIAFQKIEALEREPKQWQLCFSSLSEQNLQAHWKYRKFETSEAGVTFRAAPGAPAVAASSLERRKQLRQLARSFTARILTNPQESDSQEMRLLTTPLTEFENEKTKVLEGAVFGYATNGTNPDLLIVFLARPIEGKDQWHYAPARMTIGEITILHDKKSVWECSFATPGESVFPTWTYFQTLRMPFDEKK
jgi:hypothetical protein